MRIIAGDFKGRKIEAPEGFDVRPTTDKVKEALFSIIQNELYDAVCVDLFSGTGNLGLEALSRGAKSCYFGDNSRLSINIIKKNIESIHPERVNGSDAHVVFGDFAKTLEQVKKREGYADIILVDPPYDKNLYIRVLEKITELDVLSDKGIVVLEHRPSESIPEKFGKLSLLKQRKYGQIMLSIFC